MGTNALLLGSCMAKIYGNPKAAMSELCIVSEGFASISELVADVADELREFEQNRIIVVDKVPGGIRG